ncbi:serine/threonine-protein kinase [Defluviimonas aestuarii]|uniref:serine/threonine protein kinase n=1 Tax=Albidovulum aestuarii TaxID=1130726 RepID=UPI00249B893E|nr:serine/threonine-protein kinase [Defluviimonas aestuarii]MDI3337727.1 serine/threonine-protein kinase [Defluviimonas aestuarii]
MIDAMPGDIFSRGQVLNNTYEIEGVLGRGGTGEVYRATNQITGRTVAIKALNSQFSGNDDYVDLMKREEQMRDIRDDAVVRYTECSRSDQGHVFLVMDYIDGPSLNDEMAARRMEVRELLIIAHRVALGLRVAHRNGIVHRDLSPDNVILKGGSAEQAVIIDFGIAKDTGAGARTIVGNDFAGKYEYAAPEQVEGRAEKRSDFYALGALLLAAFRGAIPFAGATPGEMVRRKQQPLDTLGVPEPLKGLIDWLSAPDLAGRPASADEIVGRLDALLDPKGRGAAPKVQAPRPRGRLGWLVLPVLLLLGAGAYFGGVADWIGPPELPVAEPFRFEARAGVDGVALSGNAPDAESAGMLVDAFAARAGSPPPPDALTLAQGVPSDTWPGSVADLLGRSDGLEDWRIDVAGMNARVAGLAANGAARREAEDRLQDWARAGGFALATSIVAGPRDLPVAEVAALLKEVADCGTLVQNAAGESYALGDTITVTGSVAQSATKDVIRSRLADAVGDRHVRVEVSELNSDICTVRQALPDLAQAGLSIWLGDGATGAANLSGAYHVDDNPIIEVHAPASLTEGSLWVVVVDNTGKVFNLLPNINFEEQRIHRLGVVEDGIRRIRVLHSIDEFRADPRVMAMKIAPTDFGKSEIVAILSRENLFDIRRPRDESTASFAEALTAIQAQSPENITAVATRLLDSGP